MRSGFLLRLLFVLYCVEVGTFFLIWPWISSYDRVWIGLGWNAVRSLAQSGVARSLLSAFGALHVVWALHDLDLMLFRRSEPR
jgi:hypothetical protein